MSRSTRGSIIALRSVVATIQARSSTPSTLLVVDDDPDARQMLCELFEHQGFRVKQAEDGAAAIRFLEHNEPPSAILLDLVMPGITGTGVIAYLASTPRLESVPVAIVSGTPDLAPPGYPVFKKPFRFAALLEFVHTVCGASSDGSGVGQRPFAQRLGATSEPARSPGIGSFPVPTAPAAPVESGPSSAPQTSVTSPPVPR